MNENNNSTSCEKNNSHDNDVYKDSLIQVKEDTSNKVIKSSNQDVVVSITNLNIKRKSKTKEKSSFSKNILENNCSSIKL